MYPEAPLRSAELRQKLGRSCGKNSGLWMAKSTTAQLTMNRPLDMRAMATKIANAAPSEKPYAIPMGGGLLCRVNQGKKSFSLRIRVDGVERRFKIGNFGTLGNGLSVADAYKKAEDLRALVAKGEDPETQAYRKGLQDDRPKTVKDAAERFITEYVEVKLRPSTAHETKRILRNEVIPKVGFLRMGDLRKDDLQALVNKKYRESTKRGGKGTIANRLASAISSMLGYASRQMWIPQGIELSGPADVSERERVLSDKELGAAYNALGKAADGASGIQPVYARVLMALALTGARSSDVTNLRREDVDTVSEMILIREGKTRPSRRTLPCPPELWSIIGPAVEAADGKDALLFPAPRSGKRISHQDVSKACRKIVKALGIARFTPHDLRRTAVTTMSEARVPEEIRRRVTGHQAHDVHGRIYDQAERLDEVRDALVTIENRVLRCAATVEGGNG